MSGPVSRIDRTFKVRALYHLRRFLVEREDMPLKDVMDLNRVVSQIDKVLTPTAFFQEAERERQERQAAFDTHAANPQAPPEFLRAMERSINAELNRRILELEQDEGSEEVSISLLPSDLKYVETHWHVGRKFDGSDATRRQVAEIMEGLAGRETPASGSSNGVPLEVVRVGGRRR